MNVELPVSPVREGGEVYELCVCGGGGGEQAERSTRGAVWGLTGIIEIRADNEEGARERDGEREEECETAKLTLTLSITFHLTLTDDNVDMRPGNSDAPALDRLLV